MKLFPYYWILPLLLCLSIETLSQSFTGNIKGKIMDKVTKQSIPGVTVMVKGTQQGVSSDSAGIFTLTNIKEGDYSIVVDYIGYQEKTINDIQVYRNKTNYLEIEIQESNNTLNEVVISSFKYKNNPLTPVSEYSFSREEISLNPGAQGDIFRAIGMLPGVSSSGGEYSAIAVRGQGTRDNIYMVDDYP